MTTVGITGAAGFLGWHVACRLKALGVEVVEATRATFMTPNGLDAFVKRVDVVLHIAGVNRASTDEEVYTGNIDLARSLAAVIERTGRPVHLAYANSTHSSTQSPYGRAKLAAAEILGGVCEQTNASFLNLVLPHLYGEFGRPEYNSAVTTFAHALVTNREVDIDRAGNLELLHAQDVALRMAEFVASPNPGLERMEGRRITVGEVWDLLRRQHQRYVVEHVIPRFDNRFELRIFNLLRSQLYADRRYVHPLTVHADQRGQFSELCRADGTGQTSVSTSKPGVSRGDHFHFDKVERFVVIGGDAQISLRRLLTNEVHRFKVSGANPVAIDMPPLVTHNVVNESATAVTTMFWAADHFDPANPDTFSDPVDLAS